VIGQRDSIFGIAFKHMLENPLRIGVRGTAAFHRYRVISATKIQL